MIFSYFRLVDDNLRIYVGITNCLTVASTSYKNCFQYARAPLTQLIKENALLLAANFSIVPSKLVKVFLL